MLLNFPGSIKKKIFEFFSLTGEFTFKSMNECIFFKIPKIHSDLIKLDATMTPALIDLEVVFGKNYKNQLMDYLMDPRTEVYRVGGMEFLVTRGQDHFVPEFQRASAYVDLWQHEVENLKSTQKGVHIIDREIYNRILINPSSLNLDGSIIGDNFPGAKPQLNQENLNDSTDLESGHYHAIQERALFMI